jgi:hypothetical protein
MWHTTRVFPILYSLRSLKFRSKIRSVQNDEVARKMTFERGLFKKITNFESMGEEYPFHHKGTSFSNRFAQEN